MRWRQKIRYPYIGFPAISSTLIEAIEHPKKVVEIVGRTIYIIIETAVLQLDKLVILEFQVLVFNNLANLCSEIVAQC